MLKGFREFILRGNVVDMAVGVVIGADRVLGGIGLNLTSIACRHIGGFTRRGHAAEFRYRTQLDPDLGAFPLTRS